jgi:transcriptional regulator with XRE-family HTH domain
VKSLDNGSSAAPLKLLTAAEVAERTGLSVETLAQWRSQGRGIPYVKISLTVGLRSV